MIKKTRQFILLAFVAPVLAVSTGCALSGDSPQFPSVPQASSAPESASPMGQASLVPKPQKFDLISARASSLPPGRSSRSSTPLSFFGSGSRSQSC